MKPKLFNFEAFTISETSRKLGYKSTKTLYRLLNKDVLEDYIFYEKSGRVYLMLEPPNLLTLAEKIKANIQIRRNNIIKRFN
ncbi:hypothetical protein OAX96_01555 [Prochlorococcus sp. AH-736-K15]|nr:hypothetical protein [Prochlorococcus sp. AH-736-K15]|tara:strand:- start:24 stop:269 length:246 start_codon:yes stop_codon:yes gene_type:complete